MAARRPGRALAGRNKEQGKPPPGLEHPRTSGSRSARTGTSATESKRSGHKGEAVEMQRSRVEDEAEEKRRNQDEDKAQEWQRCKQVDDDAEMRWSSQEDACEEKQRSSKEEGARGDAMRKRPRRGRGLAAKSRRRHGVPKTRSYGAKQDGAAETKRQQNAEEGVPTPRTGTSRAEQAAGAAAPRTGASGDKWLPEARDRRIRDAARSTGSHRT